MAFPQNGTLDDFNRANGVLGSAWTTYSTTTPPVISASKATNTVPATSSGAYWNASQPGPDSETHTDVVTRPADGSSVQIFMRYSVPDDDFAGPLFVRDDIGGDYVQLSANSCSFNWNDGDSIGAGIAGSILYAYHKPSGGSWTLLGSEGAGFISGSGYLGFILGDATAVIDNFGGGSGFAPDTSNLVPLLTHRMHRFTS